MTFHKSWQGFSTPPRPRRPWRMESFVLWKREALGPSRRNKSRTSPRMVFYGLVTANGWRRGGEVGVASQTGNSRWGAS